MIVGLAMRRYGWLLAALVILAFWMWPRHAPAPAASPPAASTPQIPMPTPQSLPSADATAARDTTSPRNALPDEARDTLQRIAHGGPFVHQQDGAIFQNREHRLPPQANGYYREYTVATPGAGDRGARRIISGGGFPGESPPVEYFYSDDHYRSFHAIPGPTVQGERQ